MLNTGINGIQQSITNGFAGVQQSMCNGFNQTQVGMLQGFNSLPWPTRLPPFWPSTVPIAMP